MLKVINPKVSIIIPVYNGANYMVQAIDSALSQTFSNIEILVINDGSRDKGETERIARSYGDKIRYFHKENGGVASAINFGIREMNGDYFSWLSHDDMYAPEKIEEQVAALSGYDFTAIAYTDYVTVNEVGKVTKQFKLSQKSEISMRCFLALDVDTGLHGCSLLIPRLLFEKHGFFDESLKCTQDYDLWIKFASDTQFIHVNKYLVFSRQHAEQDSKTKTEICTTEADRLHSVAITDLTTSDLNLYTNGNITSLLPTYRIFRNAGYHLTAAALLRRICTQAASPEDLTIFAEIFREWIFDIDERLAQEYLQSLQTLLNPQQKRPILLFFNNVWFNGGVERVISILTRYLVDEFAILVITLDSRGGFRLPPNVCHINIGNNANYVERVLEFATFIKPAVFIGNPNIFADFLSIYAALRERGIKSIACNHSYYFLPLWRPWLYSVFSSRDTALKSANIVTWLTSFSSQVYGLSHSNAALMPNPLSFPVNENAEQLQDNSGKTVLCIGRFHDEIKRLDRALKVFAVVLKDHPEAKLCLVGDYDLDICTDPNSSLSLRDLLITLSIPDANIEFAGEQSSVDDYYKKGSLLVLTSDMEGFGMVLAEAGAYGLPAVIFDVPGLEDIITDGVNGFIVPQDDINCMAEKVSYLLADANVRKKMGDIAKTMVRRFDQQIIADRWKKLIHLLLAHDDQEKINEALKADFMPPLPNNETFTRKVASIYNGYLCRLTDQFSSRPASSEQEIRALNQQLHAISNSWSWRITKPMRSLIDFLTS